jgi:hypothetical protein
LSPANNITLYRKISELIVRWEVLFLMAISKANSDGREKNYLDKLLFDSIYAYY